MTAGLPAAVVTGWSLHLPEVDPTEALAGLLWCGGGSWVHTEAASPAQAKRLLGRKGLLYKEPATRMALCAVHRALGLPAGTRPEWPLSPRTAVVACGNLGNVATVAQVARTVTAEGNGAVSVLDAPNVSSNVLASSVALWFRFGGPNLLVCSGSTAGLDGLRLAMRLLSSERADQVVLVGAEPADEVATAWYASGGQPRPLRAGAACLVLTRPTGEPTRVNQLQVELLPGDGTGAWPRQPRLVVGPGGFDPAEHWGDCYGAQPLVALAVAAHLAADEGHGIVGMRGEGEDGSGAALLSMVDPTAGEEKR